MLVDNHLLSMVVALAESIVVEMSNVDVDVDVDVVQRI